MTQSMAIDQLALPVQPTVWLAPAPRRVAEQKTEPGQKAAAPQVGLRRHMTQHAAHRLFHRDSVNASRSMQIEAGKCGKMVPALNWRTAIP